MRSLFQAFLLLKQGGTQGLKRVLRAGKEKGMRNRLLNRILVGWIIVIVIVALVGDVTVAASNNGRTSADFLQIGLGARAAGLGGAFTAVSEGPVASYWNPAGLSRLPGRQVSLGHFAWFQDVTLEHGTFAFPVWDDIAMAVSVTYLNYGQIDGYDINGLSTGELSAHDISAGLSLGADLSDDLSVGITVKYISQSMDIYRASTNAVDLGVKYYLDNVTLAAAVSNLGTKLTFYKESENLPAAARLGLAVSPFRSNLLVAVELEKEFYGDITFRQGVEVDFEGRYHLRTGYDYRAGADGGSFVNGLSMGAGVSLDFAEFDYAFTPRSNAASEDLHRFSINFKLDR